MPRKPYRNVLLVLATRTAPTAFKTDLDNNLTRVEYMTPTMHGRGGWAHESARAGAPRRDHSLHRSAGVVDATGRRHFARDDSRGAHAPGRRGSATGPGSRRADGRLWTLATRTRGRRESLGARRVAINRGRRGERAIRAARRLTARARRETARCAP